jgi:hypothetical protein
MMKRFEIVVHNSRILHQNSAIDIAGLSWCMIPVQKYSVVCDRLIRAKLTPGPPSGNGPGHRGGQRRPLGIAPKDRSILHDRRSGRRPRRCKVFGPNRTKMLHVTSPGLWDCARSCRASNTFANRRHAAQMIRDGENILVAAPRNIDHQ